MQLALAPPSGSRENADAVRSSTTASPSFAAECEKAQDDHEFLHADLLRFDMKPELAADTNRDPPCSACAIFWLPTPNQVWKNLLLSI